MSHAFTTKLIRALKQEGIAFETDGDGNVIVNDDVRAFMEARALVHDPDNPVILTEEELLYGVDSDEDKDEDEDDPGYDFVARGTPEEVRAMIDDGTAEVGTSELRSPTPRHNSVEVYIGPVKELRGKGCIVQRDPSQASGVACQFDDATLVLNGRALGYGWHDFPAEHISDARPFIERWRDIPAALRAPVRKARGFARVHPSGRRFMKKKEMRRGTPGAFGKGAAMRQALRMRERSGRHMYLVNVITDNDDDNKSMGINARNEQQARAVAYFRHQQEFPDQRILSVEVHDKISTAVPR